MSAKLKSSAILLLTQILLFFQADSQMPSYKHPSALGVHFTLQNFRSYSPFTQLNKYDKSFQLTYLQGLSSHFDWQLDVTGSFADSISKRIGSKGQKTALVQTGATLRTRLSSSTKAFQPYFLSGFGIAHYDRHFHGYGVVGPGIQMAYKDVFVLLNAQYHLKVTQNWNNSYLLSFGIAGITARPKKQKDTHNVQILQRVPLPDKDMDGITDSLDQCVNVPGSMQFNGCPDKDGDGIIDKNDKCPEVPGIPQYYGCPVPDTNSYVINDLKSTSADNRRSDEINQSNIENQIKQQIELAAKKILFKTGSYDLVPSSYSELNAILEVLKENKKLCLAIQGHTDNVGNGAVNQLLSENRAKAIVQYLISNGIAGNRLRSEGFGMQRPVASNNTAEGRSLNRRVEILID